MKIPSYILETDREKITSRIKEIELEIVSIESKIDNTRLTSRHYQNNREKLKVHASCNYNITELKDEMAFLKETTEI